MWPGAEQEERKEPHAIAAVLEAFRRMRQLAIRDSLTGLFNRRHIEQELDLLRRKARQRNSPIGIALVDIDGFKQVNDRYGHVAGDEVLVELAGLLRESLSGAAGLIGRYGGDEFVVLLPEANPEGVRSFGRRLIERVRQHVFLAGRHDLRLTVSVGIACLEGAEVLGTPWEEMLSRADRALYAAKQHGRGLVSAPPRDPDPPASDCRGSCPSPPRGRS